MRRIAAIRLVVRRDAVAVGVVAVVHLFGVKVNSI